MTLLNAFIQFRDGNKNASKSKPRYITTVNLNSTEPRPNSMESHSTKIVDFAVNSNSTPKLSEKLDESSKVEPLVISDILTPSQTPLKQTGPVDIKTKPDISIKGSSILGSFSKYRIILRIILVDEDDVANKVVKPSALKRSDTGEESVPQKHSSLHLEKLKLDYEAKINSLKVKESELEKKLSEFDSLVEKRLKELVAYLPDDVLIPGPDGY